MDKAFYNNCILEPSKLKYDVNKILNYDGVKLAHLVLTFNNRTLSDTEYYRCLVKGDFRNDRIEVLNRVHKPSQKFIDFDTIGLFKEIEIENKLLAWVLSVFHVKNVLYLVWRHKTENTEVHGLVDYDILNDRRIDISRLSPKYRINVDKYYIYHRSRPLHRMLLNTKDDMDVDHLNLVTTDNRMSNIREVTNRENILNRGVFKNSTTGVKGVMPIRINKQLFGFTAEILVNGKLHSKRYAISKYGYEQALQMAITQRKSWDKFYGYRTSTRQNR
ncbi:MAG: HNH endonuclease [Sarcina sp.]